MSATLDESRLESAIGKLAEVLLPDELADARGALVSDSLELRDRFLAEVPQLISAEIGAQAKLTEAHLSPKAMRYSRSAV